MFSSWDKHSSDSEMFRATDIEREFSVNQMLIHMQRCSNTSIYENIIWSSWKLQNEEQRAAFDQQHFEHSVRRSALVWERNTELRHRRVSEAAADLRRMQHHMSFHEHLHSSPAPGIKDLTLNFFTSKHVSVVTVWRTDSRRDVSSSAVLFLFHGFRNTQSCLETSFLSAKRSKRKTGEEQRRKLMLWVEKVSGAS